MNCLCYPPLPATIRVSNTNNANFGKEYFCCRADKCNLFSWVGAEYPNTIQQLSRPNNMTEKDIKLNMNQNVNSRSFVMEIIDIDLVTMKAWFNGPSPNSKEMLLYYESIPKEMKFYRTSLKRWEFDLEIYDSFIQNFKSFTNVKLEGIPPFVFNAIKGYFISKRKEGAGVKPHLNIEKSLLDILMGFQKRGIEFAIENNGRAFIADDMGLGKTVQAIGLLQHYRDFWPALILCPPNIIDQWNSELLKYCPSLITKSDICIVKKGKDKIFGKIVIFPYTLLHKLENLNVITPDIFGVVIADESHNIKNPKCQQSITAGKFLNKIKFAFCLSGTPATNRPIELFAQLKALLPNEFGDYNAFIRRYCDAKPSRFSSEMDASGQSHMNEFKLLTMTLVMIRRLKEDILDDLPKKKRELRSVAVDPKYVKILKDLEKEAEEIKGKQRQADLQRKTDESMKYAMDLRRNINNQYSIAGMAKLPALKGIIKELINEAMNNFDTYDFEKSQEDVVIDVENPIAQDDRNIHEIIQEAVMQADLVEKLDASLNEENNDDSELVSTSKKKRKSQSNTRVSIDEIDIKESEKSDISKGISSRDNLVSLDSSVPCIAEIPKKKSQVATQFLMVPSDSDDDSVEEKMLEVYDLTEQDSPKHVEEAQKNDAIQEVSKKSKTLRKIIVFGHHVNVMDALESFLKEQNVTYIRVDGKTSKKAKFESIQKFQEDNETLVALLSITACGTGLNLTRANVSLFAEFCWSLGNITQAEDRIHRLGQTSKYVRIIYVEAKGSEADRRIWESLQNKYKVIRAAIGMTTSKDEKYQRGMHVNRPPNATISDSQQELQKDLDVQNRSVVTLKQTELQFPILTSKVMSSDTVVSFPVKTDVPSHDLRIVNPSNPPVPDTLQHSIYGFNHPYEHFKDINRGQYIRGHQHLPSQSNETGRHASLVHIPTTVQDSSSKLLAPSSSSNSAVYVNPNLEMRPVQAFPTTKLDSSISTLPRVLGVPLITSVPIMIPTNSVQTKVSPDKQIGFNQILNPAQNLRDYTNYSAPVLSNQSSTSLSPSIKAKVEEKKRAAQEKLRLLRSTNNLHNTSLQ